LKFIISSSQLEGHLHPFEEGSIRRVLELGNYVAREIMVPRNDVVSISAGATLDEVLALMTANLYSRVPVYEGRPENIVGILHYRDLLRVWQERRWATEKRRSVRPFDMLQLVRKPLVIPETKPLDQLIDEFRAAHTHMALVVDEFGTIVGLLTFEDVLEQVFGEIEDEHDVKRQAPVLEAPLVELEGAISIRDLETQYGIELPGDAGFETLAGFVLYQLGYIPRAGDTVEHAGRKFTIVQMDRNRIATVRIEKIEAPAEAS
jgi:CBS domain containing-hemolysin-like protein